MAVVYKTGDLFTSEAQVLGHGVNTSGVMGAGIALQFARRYPDMKRAYIRACTLGALTPGSVFPYSLSGPEGPRWVLNMATQERPGRFANLDYVEDALDASLYEMMLSESYSLAIPRIGCGIGGLAWDDVRGRIEETAARYPDITVEVWTMEETP